MIFVAAGLAGDAVLFDAAAFSAMSNRRAEEVIAVDVLGLRDSFEVGWVTTRLEEAAFGGDMIDNEVFGDFANGEEVGDTVGVDRVLGADAELGIAILTDLAADPRPAFIGFTDVNLRPKAQLVGAGEFGDTLVILASKHGYIVH